MPDAETHRLPQSVFGQVCGIRLHWTECGEGFPVVIIPGLQDSQCTWTPVIVQLAKRYRVLTLDLAGCGLSDRPDASYTLEWHARIVAAWMDSLGCSEFDVVGHSFGGGVALWLLLYRARCIRRLALIAPGGLGREVGLWLRLASIPWLVEFAGQPWMKLGTQALIWRSGRGLDRDVRDQLLAFNGAPGTARALARTVRDVIRWRGQTRHFLQRAEEIGQLPSIALFWGENDHVIPVAHGEMMRSLLEHCSLFRFKDAGHFLHWQMPDALAEALTAFFDAPTMPRSHLRQNPS